jgi:rod shape-determining protein MreC
MMTVDHRYQYLNGVRDVLGTVVYPFQYLMQLPTEHQGLARAESGWARRVAGRERPLARKADFLERAVAEIDHAGSGKPPLALLAGIGGEHAGAGADCRNAGGGFRSIPASHSAQSRRQHGVYVGQPVLDQHGVIGQIIHADPFTATAILVTDASHACRSRSIAPGCAPWRSAPATSRS